MIDSNEFQQLLTEWRAHPPASVRRLAARLGLSFEELAQDVCLTAWGHRDRFHVEAPGSTEMVFHRWIERLARNRAIDLYRMRSRRPEVALSEERAEEIPASAGPARATWHLELEDALATLAPLDRDLMEARLSEGLTMKELAARFNLSVVEASRKVNVLFEQLRQRLGNSP
jgi:RNA polymerase sigma factor (sigma-70 family)